MNKIFCRQGSKTDISAKIINLIPEHDLYVEPFAGGASIYFKKEPSKKEILNDKDKDLIKGYRLIKKAKLQDAKKYDNKENDPKNDEDIRKLYNQPIKNDVDRLLYYILKFCNTFNSSGRGQVYKKGQPLTKIRNLEAYKKRVKNTTFLNQDYKKIIEKYDGVNTFFYLDPPYEGSKKDKIYNHSIIDYDELNRILTNIKGKFILSINDSPNIRNTFKTFRMKKIIIKGKANKEGSSGHKDRNELIISNF